mmetsp:Transcript_41586/g.114597  ORF Transcript_41586/g.114597 Transcript_41586/m.114597 type:complete len:215 (-) Transcript_41586:116-760(-)
MCSKTIVSGGLAWTSSACRQASGIVAQTASGTAVASWFTTCASNDHMHETCTSAATDQAGRRETRARCRTHTVHASTQATPPVLALPVPAPPMVVVAIGARRLSVARLRLPVAPQTTFSARRICSAPCQTCWPPSAWEDRSRSKECRCLALRQGCCERQVCKVRCRHPVGRCLCRPRRICTPRCPGMASPDPHRPMQRARIHSLQGRSIRSTLP